MKSRLEVFVAAAQFSSLTKAARSLAISQPAVSKNIKELESEYNVTLFKRGAGKMELTPEGERFLVHARKILGCYRDLNEDLSYFSVDYRAESKRAVEYLLQIGHRRIAVISENKSSEVCAQRIDGWRDAFLAEGLEPPEELNSRDNSLTGIERFLLERRPTAIFAAIGSCVMPTLLAVERAQLRIPDELSFFSFDDMGGATLPDVPISCVKMPLETMGELAVDFLSGRCDDPENTPPVHRLMPSALVINDSCRKLSRR